MNWNRCSHITHLGRQELGLHIVMKMGRWYRDGHTLYCETKQTRVHLQVVTHISTSQYQMHTYSNHNKISEDSRFSLHPSRLTHLKQDLTITVSQRLDLATTEGGNPNPHPLLR